MLWIFIYLSLIGLAIWAGYKRNVTSIFKSSSKVGWIASGISLLMIRLSADQGQMLTGIISKHGMSGIWLVFGGMLGAFVIPVVFAPLWHRLDLENDNDFYLFRYPGQAGRVLMTFRTFYVGLLVSSLMLAFHIIGFSRIIIYFFNCSAEESIFYSSATLILYAFKNTLDIKIKTDAIHGLFYLLTLVVIVFSILFSSRTGFEVKSPQFDKSLFPNSSDTLSFFSVMVFLGVQWWSSNLFDGGGPEMSRFTAVKSEAAAVRSGVLSVLLGVGLSTLMLIIVLYLLGRFGVGSEGSFFNHLLVLVPVSFHTLLLIGFFGVFISTAEAILNWGSSFLTLSCYKRFIAPEANDLSVKKVGFAVMVMLSSMATIFAYKIGSLEGLIKITFSISAGVAPVYILRWFWFRINAWSQMSAMISSALGTLLYPSFHGFFVLKDLPMEESRILMVTISTTVIWVVVTLVTKCDVDCISRRMLPIIGDLKLLFQKMVVALLMGIILFELLIILMS